MEMGPTVGEPQGYQGVMEISGRVKLELERIPILQDRTKLWVKTKRNVQNQRVHKPLRANEIKIQPSRGEL